MEEFLRNLLEGSAGFPAYATVFGILVACGLGVPMPEDISLITGGYLAHLGSVELVPMMAVGFVGILVGDSLIYMAGRRVGSRIGSGAEGGFFARVVTPEKRAKVESLFARHGEKIVMMARFLPGVRAVTYFTAGSLRMSYLRFIAFDGLAAIASAPMFVYLGYRFGGQLDMLLEKFKEGQLVVLAGAAAAIIAYLVYRRWRTNAQKRAQAQAQARQAAEGAPPAPVAEVGIPPAAPNAAPAPVRVSDATSG